MALREKEIRWYYIAIPIILIMFCPMSLLTIKPSPSVDIVAIPANEPSLLSPVSPVFSRCPYFIIYDLKHHRAKYLVNNFADGKHEIGLHVAHLILREKAGIVIGKNVGPEPYEHLSKRGIRIYNGVAINVQDAIYKFQNNQLEKTSGPTGFSKTFKANKL